MNDHLVNSLVTIATAIVGVAILAVLVSQRAQTSNVISAAGNAFAADLSAAVAPLGDGGGLARYTGGYTGGSPISSLNY